MTPPQSKYGPLHALAAGAVFVYMILSGGFAAFWHHFLHGSVLPTDEKAIIKMLRGGALFFGGLFLVLWVTTFFHGRNKRDCDNGHLARCNNWGNGRLTRCVHLTLLSAIPICLIASGLNWASGELLSRITDVELSEQVLVKLVTSQSFSIRGKVILFSFLLLEAPIVEELLFRGVVFGGLTKVMPVWSAMALSGFLFALIHVNAVTMIPLWFLGIAFAWLYFRTGTLLAPMAVHFTFNAINLAFCLFS